MKAISCTIGCSSLANLVELIKKGLEVEVGLKEFDSAFEGNEIVNM
jgi:hypothetical protein